MAPKNAKSHIFPLNDNPGPGQYEFISVSNKFSIKGPIIKKEINPLASYLSRIPSRNIPGP
jgi:hypothetical protein